MDPIEGTDAVIDGARGPVEWTRQQRRLWAGRADERPVGTIEQDLHGFTFVDTDGRARWTCRHLEDAQRAVESGTIPVTIQRRASVRPSMSWAVTFAIVAGLAVVVLAIGLAVMSW